MTDRRDNDSHARADAADWAARIDAGVMDDEAWSAFAAWIAAPAHLAAFEAAQRRMALVDAAASADPSPLPAPPTRRALPVFRSAGFAAAGLCALALSVFVAVRPHDDALRFTAGPQAQAVTLPDHSAVTLRAGAHMEARFGRDRRDVALSPGSEATFDVAKDPARPFVIALGAHAVRVVGTAFDIVYKPGLTRVSVSRGVVQVSGVGPGGRVERLRAGQAVTIRSGDVWTNSAIRPENVGAWRGQRLFFDQDTLEVVANSIAEATDVRVVVQPAVRSVRFTGVLRLGSAEQMAHALELYLPVRTRVADGQITVDRRGAQEPSGAAD